MATAMYLEHYLDSKLQGFLYVYEIDKKSLLYLIWNAITC